MLAVEVADTSLNYDRTVKLALYGSNLIPEVWIVNLATEEVEVYRLPVGDAYTVVARAGRFGYADDRSAARRNHSGRQDIWVERGRPASAHMSIHACLIRWRTIRWDVT